MIQWDWVALGATLGGIVLIYWARAIRDEEDDDRRSG